MIGRVLKGTYRIYDLIGENKAATVYLARDTLRNEMVAIKVFKPGLLDDRQTVNRFLHRARMLTSMDCSHTARMFDYGVEDGLAFTVMDYAEGQTLFRILERQGPLDLEWALDIAAQVAQCLADAHEKGILHRNLLPANILITAENQVMVTGFDVLGRMEGRVENPYYLAPEAVEEGRADIRADIYSLGATLFQMLTGRVPYDGLNAEEIAEKHRQAPIPSVREFKAELPPAVDNLIRRCLAKRPHERFQTPLDLLEAIEEVRYQGTDLPTLTNRRLGQYYILDPIGEGGMATVYKAYQSSLDRYVAVKVLSPYLAHEPDFSSRFEREAKAIARLEYPHILPIYDFGQEEDMPYIVMRYIPEGMTLRDIMDGPIEVKTAVTLVIQMGRALDYAHRRGVIHLDVKPTNILLDEEGWAFLSDFGLSRVMQHSALLMTRTGVRMGTPKYMSPEQGQGAPLDGRSDVYSLGVVLYELLTGRVPFDGETPLDVIEKHLSEYPIPPRQIVSSIPRDVERVILKALAKRPKERYLSMGDMVNALEHTSAATPWPWLRLREKRQEKGERSSSETTLTEN